MGQNSSAPLGVRGGRRKSLRDAWRSPFPRRSQTHQGALSATFHFVDDDKYVEQLNVNTASEEELMTLPGITRAIAQSIVEYRQAIGGFKKIEDLALVSGIGAEKLDFIRPEICVRRKNVSCASSRAPSCDSLPISEIAGYGRVSNKVINVNTASVFDLMLLHGMTQELAANVVYHRERRGPFNTIDDLLKVKGINPLRLGALRSQLSTVPVVEESVAPKNGITPSFNYISNGKIPGHRKNQSVSLKSQTLANGFLAIEDIFELLSAKSLRPVIEDDFCYERGGRPAIRLASWNVQDLTREKVENPGVREVVCRTFLENRFTIIALQEVQDGIALSKLCSELNSPSLRRVAEWKDNSRQWKTVLPENNGGLGFLYDSSKSNLLSALGDFEENSHFGLAALLAVFQFGDLYAAVVNIHVQDCNAESVRQLEQSVKAHLKPTDPLLILGDFTGTARSQELDNFQTGLKYRPIVPATVSTAGPDAAYNNSIADNIFLNTEAQLQFTGVWGIVRQGLSHLAIPRGWMWGGAVSVHCPVWCELFTQPLLAESAPILPDVSP